MSDNDLEPLVTECPNCLTRFRVTETQLQVAVGRVRCGSCLTVFKGVDRLLWEKDPELPEGQAGDLLDELLDELGDPSDEHMEVAAETVEIDSQGEVDASEDEEKSAQAFDAASVEEVILEEVHDEADLIEEVKEELLDVVIDSIQGDDDPQQADAVVTRVDGRVPIDDPESLQLLSEQFAEARAAGEPVSFVQKKRGSWWIPPAMVLAIAALFAQVMYLQFDDWTEDLRIRPVYESVCAFIGCELPVLRDLDQMVIKKLVVRSHPEIDGALIVDAIIVNEAPFAQPFPVLELRFTSLEGNLVASGRFQPRQYLAGELEGAEKIQRLTPVHIELEFEDPGSEAVNYFMEFR